MYAAIAAALICWQNLMQTEPSNMQVNRFFINTIMSIAHLFIYLFIIKFVQLGTQIKHNVKKENIQKYTKSTL